MKRIKITVEDDCGKVIMMSFMSCIERHRMIFDRPLILNDEDNDYIVDSVSIELLGKVLDEKNKS